MRDSTSCKEDRRADRASAPIERPDMEALLARGRAAVHEEAAALLELACNLDGKFAAAAALIVATRGLVVVSGVGKSWLVGARLPATLTATGTPSVTLHPTEALHGDLGRLRQGDLLLVLSNSGETAEVLALIDAARTAVPDVTIVALTGNGASSIARASGVAVSVGAMREVCPLGLAPTTSAIAMAALGDALAVAAAAARGFSMRDFARLHPGGQLGRRTSAARTDLDSGSGRRTFPGHAEEVTA